MGKARNRCAQCGYQWTPRGATISLKCPNCSSRKVILVKEGGCCGCLLLVILVLGAYSLFNSRSSDDSSGPPRATSKSTGNEPVEKSRSAPPRTSIPSKSLESSPTKATEPTGPVTLVDSRTWTRASDSKTFVASALHVRAGEVVLADASGNWYAVKVSILIPSDVEILRSAMVDAPVIPAGHLIGSTREKAKILLGPPSDSTEMFDSWNWPLAEAGLFSIKTGGGTAITGFMIDLGWKGDLNSLLERLGLDYMKIDSRSKVGPLEKVSLKAPGQRVLFRGTEAEQGWSPVNFDFE